MEAGKAFAILGIGETKEEDAIKGAYRQKLRLVNPEDDPEGFKQLREAYETAVSYAKQNEVQNEGTDDTPSGLFVQRAAALYASMKGRQDQAAWEALFMDPAFLDLEEEENCREKLITFLMNHYYFPTQIWRILDKGLQIEQEKQKLYEKFPKDFIDFTVRKIQRGEDFEFDQLTGEDDADLDGWIFLFSKAGREEVEKNYASMEETIREAQEKGIDHPGFEMMKARLLQEKGETACADEIVENLLTGAFGESLNVRYQSAEYFWNSQRRERAIELYQKIKDADRKHYMANRRLAQWNLKQRQYAEAKSCANVLLSYPLDEEGKEMVDRINAGLEQELEQKISENPQDLKARIDLGWCYLQDEKTERAIELMEGCVPSAQQEKDFVNLMGKVYYYAKQYEKARPIIQRWAALLTEQLPKDAQSREDDCERIATAHSMLSQIYVAFAKGETGAQRDRLFETAIEELNRAGEAHENPGQEYGRAQVYMEWQKYEECIRICENLKEKYPEFQAAVILHQKASAKLYDASGVLGDYFTLRQLAPDYAESWELAAEVYYQLKRTEDLEKLLKEAQEAGVMTGRLQKYQFFRMTDQAQTRAELLDALEYARKICENWGVEEWSDQEKADFISERARNYWRISEYETALGLIEEAIGLSDHNLLYVYIKAGIKKDQQAYEEALKLYQSCEADYDETAHYYGNVGECYYRLGKHKEALPYLKKSVEIKEDSPVCCTWIVRILKSEMEKTECLDKMDEAMHYADLMIKHRTSSFDYIERGLLYALEQDYVKASGDFERAVEADEKDPFAHSNLARMYRLLNRMPEALEQAKQAVACADREPMPYHYEMLGCVYRQMHRYEEALAAYREIWNRFSNQRKFYLDDMVSLCNEAGYWQTAMDFLQEFYGEKGKDYVQKTVDVYCHAGFYEQAVSFLNHSCKENGMDEVQVQKAMAQIFWYQGDLKNAAQHIGRALKGYQTLAKYKTDRSDYPELCSLAADIYFYQGNREEAARWAREALEYYRTHGGFEKWLNPLEDRLLRMYDLGKLQLYAGNVATAMTMVQEMKKHPRCAGCTHCCCTDALELEAGVLAAGKEFEKAAVLLEEILKENAADRDVRMKLTLMR